MRPRLPGEGLMMVLLILLLPLAAVPDSYGDSWPTYHGGASLQGAADVSLPDVPVLLWRYRAGDSVDLTPVSGGGRIFVVSGSRIAALDMDGKLLWSRVIQAPETTGGPLRPESFLAPAVYAKGAVLAGSRSGVLHALDASTGQDRWRYSVGGPITGSPGPVRSDDGKISVIVIAQSDGTLHRVALDTGKREWKSGRVNRCDGSAAVNNGVIAFGNCDAALYAYDAGSGARINRVDLRRDGQVYAGVAFSGDRVYAGDRSGRIYAVDVAGGSILWVNEDSDDEISSTPAVDKGNLVITSDNGSVLCLDPETGKRRWRTVVDGRPSSPVIARNRIALSAGGTLYILDLLTGKTVWSREVSDSITSPALVGGMILVGTEEGTVVAFGEKD